MKDDKLTIAGVIAECAAFPDPNNGQPTQLEMLGAFSLLRAAFGNYPAFWAGRIKTKDVAGLFMRLNAIAAERRDRIVSFSSDPDCVLVAHGVLATTREEYAAEQRRILGEYSALLKGSEGAAS